MFEMRFWDRDVEILRQRRSDRRAIIIVLIGILRAGFESSAL
jgi:hypothetical protein